LTDDVFVVEATPGTVGAVVLDEELVVDDGPSCAASCGVCRSVMVISSAEDSFDFDVSTGGGGYGGG
jgi:hypothetical protein